MDPRGAGGSTPVRCFATSAAQERVFGVVSKAPAGRAQYRRDVRLARVLAARCAARNGALLDHLSTANVARDMDLVRQAVGDRQLSYYGVSYGTYLGATYAAMFPGRVRALVLDGNIDPPAYRAGPMPSTPFIRAFANVGAHDTLGQFFRLCARAWPRCAFSAGGHPAAKFARLMARVTAHPVRLPDGTVVDRGELFFLTFGTLDRASDWAGLARTLQQLYTASRPGRYRPRQATAPVPGPYDHTQDAETAILCGETANPHHPAAYPRIAAAADRRLLVVNGWGHTAFVQHNRCAERAAARYLISGKLPPSGATCGGRTRRSRRPRPDRPGWSREHPPAAARERQRIRLPRRGRAAEAQGSPS